MHTRPSRWCVMGLLSHKQPHVCSEKIPVPKSSRADARTIPRGYSSRIFWRHFQNHELAVSTGCVFVQTTRMESAVSERDPQTCFVRTKMYMYVCGSTRAAATHCVPHAGRVLREVSQILLK